MNLKGDYSTLECNDIGKLLKFWSKVLVLEKNYFNSVRKDENKPSTGKSQNSIKEHDIWRTSERSFTPWWEDSIL